MVDAQRTGDSFPLIDLTKDITSRNNNTTPCIDITGKDARCTNYNPEIIDLTVEDNQCQNYRIPVIDLTDDGVQDHSHQTQSIGSSNYASSIKHTIRNLSLTGIDYDSSNHSTNHIDLISDDIQQFDFSVPVIDLTSDNDQYLNCRIQDVDMDVDDVHDVTQMLRGFDLTEGKQQNMIDSIPTTNLTNHSFQTIDRNIPLADLDIDKYSTTCRSVINLTRNDKVFRKPTEDVEKYDLTFNNSSTSIQKNFVKNTARIQTLNLSDNAFEDDSLKFYGTLNIKEKHSALRCKKKFHCRKEVSENRAVKDCNLESRKEANFWNNALTSNFDERIQRIFPNPPRKNFESRKDEKIINHSPTNNFEETYLNVKKSEKISYNFTSDFPKPAHYPIPLRHSLGRSTVNTSKNIPIECTEESEGKSSISTASSIIRRKKSKSIDGFSPESKELQRCPNLNVEDCTLLDKSA